MMKNIACCFSIIAMMVFFISCNQDPEPEPVQIHDTIITQNHSFDTIFPSDYIMAYPGSWWQYSDGTIDSCNYWQNYPIHYSTSVNGDLYVEEDMWVIPEDLNAISNICFDSTAYTPEDLTSTRWSPVFDTVVGVFYEKETYVYDDLHSYSSYIKKETIECLDSMQIGTNMFYDIIHVRYYSKTTYSHISSGPYYTTEIFFSKSVGIIKTIRGQSGSIVSDIELVNYFIAPH